MKKLIIPLVSFIVSIISLGVAVAFVLYRAKLSLPLLPAIILVVFTIIILTLCAINFYSTLYSEDDQIENNDD